MAATHKACHYANHTPRARGTVRERGAPRLSDGRRTNFRSDDDNLHFFTYYYDRNSYLCSSESIEPLKLYFHS